MGRPALEPEPEWCRDESCEIEELHEAHVTVTMKKGPRKCRRCNSALEIKDNAKFCSSCGTWVGKDTEPANA